MHYHLLDSHICFVFFLLSFMAISFQCFSCHHLITYTSISINTANAYEVPSDSTNILHLAPICVLHIYDQLRIPWLVIIFVLQKPMNS